MVDELITWFRKASCRHTWRLSRSWPGVIVCRRCGKRTSGS